LIKAVYGQDALARLDEEEEESDQSCLVQVQPVELIELDELIIGALNKASYDFAQEGIIG
jgi:peroxin-6